MDDAGDKKFVCDACNINLLNESSMQQHLSGRKHLEMVKNQEERIRVERKCGIYVTGFPLDLSQKWILDYFAKFGTIVWSYFGDSFLLLDYSEPESASIVLKQKHNLYGRKVIIKYRELKPSRAASKVHTEPTADNFLVLIKNTPDMEHQISTLSDNLQGGCSKFSVYDRICRELYGLLSYSFPMCRIFPFGSTVTGLCFKSSDLDVYISGIKQGEDCVPHLYQIRTILRKTNLFGNALVIANAKIPILKCVHIQSGTNCDINIRNMLGVCNSNLINYYLNLDIKVRRLMLIIKFWAKSHHLTGQNHLFTNYSLSLMLIFFLQAHPYKVPSVFSLQDFKCRNIQDGWNGGFSTINFFSRHLKDVTLAQLLTEFFMFYSTFDYSASVICPYLGVPLKKTDFKQPELLYDSVFYMYKKYVAIEGNWPLKVDAKICVQDPFEHSRNTTPIVSEATLCNFMTLCRLGKKLCDEGEAGLLYRLMTETFPVKIKILKTDPDSIQIQLAMSVDTRYLEGNLGESTSNRKEELEKAWFASVNGFLLIVLKDFFNIEVNETTDDCSNKKEKKNDGQLDVHDKGDVLYSYKCSAKFNLWQYRATVSKETNTDLQSGIIDKEVAVTKKLMDILKNSNPLHNIMEFEVSLVPAYDPARISINVKKIMSHKKTFKAFGNIFAPKFASWFETYEKELNNQK